MHVDAETGREVDRSCGRTEPEARSLQAAWRVHLPLVGSEHNTGSVVFEPAIAVLSDCSHQPGLQLGTALVSMVPDHLDQAVLAEFLPAQAASFRHSVGE